MKKILKRKAFTLVELIVAMAITTILVGAAMAMFGPVSNIIKSAEEDVYANNISDVLMNYVDGKISKSTTYNIGAFDSLTGDPDTEGTVTYRLKNMLEDAKSDTSDTKCIIISKNTNGQHVLYDLGTIGNVSGSVSAGITDYNNKVNPANLKKYRVFDDNFYSDYDFRYEFETTGTEWCRISLVPFNGTGDDAEAITEKRSSMFKLLNISLHKISPTSSASLTDMNDVSYSKDNSIVIIYRIKDYTTYVPPVTT